MNNQLKTKNYGFYVDLLCQNNFFVKNLIPNFC